MCGHRDILNSLHFLLNFPGNLKLQYKDFFKKMAGHAKKQKSVFIIEKKDQSKGTNLEITELVDSH